VLSPEPESNLSTPARAGYFLHYAARSLGRNALRALMAAFCIAVGVMAVVSLQLAGAMIERGIVQSARDINQGDLSIGLSAAPLSVSDLSYFDDLRARGVITNYSAQLTSAGILELPNGRRQTVSVRIIGPGTFPLVGTASLLRPAAENAGQAMAVAGNAVLSGQFSDTTDIPIGSTLRLLTASGSFAELKLGGVAAPEDAAWRGNVLAVSAQNWQDATSSPVVFQSVSVTTAGEGQTRAAASELHRQFPLASIRTTQDVLNEAQQAVEIVRKFLILVGLLALLIGGTGIVNTMQVLLARRRSEIAVLKSAGYRRIDLYVIFSLEAAILGLAGGAAGAMLGLAVAALMRAAVARAFSLSLSFVHDPRTIAGGLAIGVCTALIFGLLPIVHAARLRPQAVFRDEPNAGEPESLIESLALIALLSVLFVVMAAFVLQSIVWALVAVYGVFILFGLIALFLNAAVWLVSHLPIPDRLTIRYFALVTCAVVVSLFCAAIGTLRGVGILLLIFTASAYTIPLLKSGARVNLRLALRNLGRARARTVTTLLALFIGVFSVASILALGLGLRSNLDSIVASRLQFNLFAATIGPSGSNLEGRLGTLPGVQQQRAGTYVQSTVTGIDGTNIALTGPGEAGPPSRVRQQLRQLSGVQGFDVSKGDLPGNGMEIIAGRNLQASDANSSSVIVPASLQDQPLGLHLGSVVSLRRVNASDAGQPFTVVGFYRPAASGPAPSFGFAPVFAPEAATVSLAGDSPLQIVYLRVPPDRAAQIAGRIQDLAPDAIVVDLDDLLSQFTRVLDDILVLISSITSMAFIAGTVIVANAVALAMLERRHELGILKAVGYTSGRVLTGVAIENALAAALAGLLAMVPVSIAVAVFGHQAGIVLESSVPLTFAIVVGIAALAALIAAAVAWQPVHVRPLNVLRYEQDC
jgi:putative ABC transport system permease protein